MLSGEIYRFFRMFGIRRVTFLTDDFFIVGDSEAAQGIPCAFVALATLCPLPTPR